MQYSYLPSWLSFLVDQSKAPGGGTGALRRGLRPVVAAAAGLPAEAATCRARAWDVRRRDRLQRRVRPAQPDRRHGLRRAAELQHAVPRVQRPPRPGQPRDPAGLQERPDGAVRDRSGPTRSRPRASPGTAPGSSTSCTRPTRSSGGAPHLVFTEPDWIGSRPARTCCRGCSGCRSSPSGRYGRPPVLDRGPGRSRPQVHDGVRRRLECRDASRGRHRRRPGGHPDGGRSAGLGV